MGGASIRGRPVQISVQGPVTIDALDTVAQQIMAKLNTVPGIRDVGESLPPQMPELEIQIDRQRCADAGISAATVGQTISTLVQGSTATQIDWQGLLTDVNVSLRDQDITNQTDLMSLSIPGFRWDFVSFKLISDSDSGDGTHPNSPGRINSR